MEQKLNRNLVLLLSGALSDLTGVETNQDQNGVGELRPLKIPPFFLQASILRHFKEKKCLLAFDSSDVIKCFSYHIPPRKFALSIPFQ